MASPYADRASRSFWRSGVVDAEPGWIEDLYRPRFGIDPTVRVATAGSCFAQHLSRELSRRGCQVMDAEPPPAGLPEATARRYGYRIYSARYGNVYTARQLAQLAQEVLAGWEPADIVWERDGRFFDALRPGVEPHGLDSPDEVRAHRAQHLRCVRRVLEEAEVLVFTLGLTEAWTHRASGTVYPTAPETIAGRFDPEHHALVNFTATQVAEDVASFRDTVQRVNPGLRLLLTVSPVPIVATATASHVLAASTYTKATLRAAAGELYDRFPDVDYFPSYELAATPFLRRTWFGPNLRALTPEGLDAVMRHFAAPHNLAEAAEPPAGDEPALDADMDGGECEEVLLEAFDR